ncbi:unnamed protein product, partial [Discosporangium mesarthrocarpum]
PTPQIPLRVSLRQLYMGDLFNTVFSRQTICLGAKSCESSCPECAGPGVVVRTQQLGPGFVQQVQVRPRG